MVTLFFFFPDTLSSCILFDFCPEHHFIFICTEFQMTFHHLSFSLFQFSLLQQETQPCGSHSMSKLQRAAGSCIDFSSTKEPWHKFTNWLGSCGHQGCQGLSPTSPSPAERGVLIRFKPSGNARTPHKGSKGRFVLQAADLPLLHLHGHSHGEKPRGNRATPSSSCAWMHFVSCTVLLHWPENHWLGAGRKLWLNKLVALFVVLLVVGFMDFFFLIGKNPTTI